MFTGIIEDLGIIESARRGLLKVRSKIFTGQEIGDSIAVNGACLTISDLKKDAVSFDIMEETLERTNLGKLKIGDKVNLERALRIGDRLGGHFVTGHIDCVAKVTDTTIISGGDTVSVTVKVAKEFIKFIAPKGSIALDGISLTIGSIGSSNFTVYLIPHTIKNTTLGFTKAGDELNVEFDLLGKYALKEATKSKITEEFLREKGFC